MHRAAPDGAVRTTTVTVIRRILLVAFVTGLIGTLVELLLLEHFDDWRQRIPLVLLGCALATMIWHALDRGPAPLRVLQLLMLIFAFAGLIGLTLHLQGNREFELEMYPSRAGLELVKKTLMGATPALAPGTMIQLALIGLAYSYRHPHLTRMESGGRT
ncbi:MAG TPA: hypothetical protein VLD67_11510 [Vicinamibacterales bacterium]|nr:hypothetical protein [Vicinamibacterales bacterium]